MTNKHTPTREELDTMQRWIMRGVKKTGYSGEMTQSKIKELMGIGYKLDQKFIEEMVLKQTPRSKKAAEVITSEVYGESFRIGNRERTIARLENEADENYRRMCLGI